MIDQADAAEWLSQLDPRTIDLLLTDPPFGHGKISWDTDSPALESSFWATCSRVCRTDAARIFFAQGSFTAKLMTVGQHLWRYNLVWEKNKTTGFLNANRMPLRCHEDICVFYQKLPTYHPQMSTGHQPQNWCRRTGVGAHYGETRQQESRAGKTDRYPRSVLRFPVVNNDDPARIHPAQKPVNLLRWLIRSYTNEGDLVVDPFAGSGSTSVAALLEGRRFRGCDSSAEHVEKANGWLRRIEEL